MTGRKASDAKRRAEQPWRAWYKTARWQRLREQRLMVEPTCRMCRARNRVTVATVVDHIAPHRGAEALFWDPTNLQSLCAAHHDSVKQAEERRGYVIGTTVEGRPLDPRHPWNGAGKPASTR